MKLRNIPFIIASALMLNSCSNALGPIDPDEETDDNQIYSFTAILDNAKSRVSYVEDDKSKDLKMVWDEADVIWLYPDASMNDPVERYEFVPNTGAGTSHTVFVHQGYIKNWEHWSGRAIYLFNNGDNFDVSHDSAEFLAKAYVQKKNGDTEHLKYAEHVLGPDGSKQYTEYWSEDLVNTNLKHDHPMTFSHPHTVVYKVMLRGFIFDIPGGSQLRMSGDAWGGEETILTLGSKDDTEPFLKVGEYGKDNYDDKVLTAYIIRQVAGNVDGSIKEGGKLKFELLTYDELDGTVMPLDPEDTMRNDNPDYGPNYLTNLPWGDEYTWDVTATKDIDYKAGDFVVADLTDTTKDHAYPKIAVDLGLPLKWAAFNVGAKKIDDLGGYATWGNTQLYMEGGNQISDIYGSPWTSGDPDHDSASYNWGNEWRTPTVNEFLDLVHYAEWLDGNDQESTPGEAKWKSDLTIPDRIRWFKTNPARQVNNVSVALVRSKVNDKYIYIHLAGNMRNDRPEAHGPDKAYYTTSSSKGGNPMIMGILQGSYSEGHQYQYYIGYTDNDNGRERKMATSVRAVKDAKD